jgi:hypothetical protein
MGWQITGLQELERTTEESVDVEDDSIFKIQDSKGWHTHIRAVPLES